MARDADGPGTKAARLGRIDPFCWLLVVPLLLSAVIMAVFGVLVATLAIVVVAGLVVVFDSWANRPDPRLRSAGADRSRLPGSSSTRSPGQRADRGSYRTQATARRR